MQDFSLETRSVYEDQHTKVSSDKVAMDRFLSMFSTEYFSVDKDFFVGKKCLDAGCGNTAKLLIALTDMGAESVTGLDLGDGFIEPSLSSFKRWSKFPEKEPKLVSGSILKLPFEDDSFDFVSCHGVLLHLNSLEEVEQAFSELSRVTKPGGLLYTVYATYGGLLEEAVFPAIREYYKSNQKFKDYIDSLDAASVCQDYRTAVKNVERFGVHLRGLEFLETLFDTDLMVTIQNVVQVPVRLPISVEMVSSLYRKYMGGEGIRLSRFVERKNIRKYAAPLHYNFNAPVSKLIYGSGSVEFKGIKEPLA